MMKYRAIQQMMVNGEFKAAKEHLDPILKRKPDDQEAVQLEDICNRMLGIINSFKEDTYAQTEIVVSDYISIHTKRIMCFLCGKSILLLGRLPESKHGNLIRNRLLTLCEKLSEADGSKKDRMRKQLFLDNRHRRVLFISLGILICIGIGLLIWIGFSGASSAPELAEVQTTEIIQKANSGNLEAQYQLGLCFYKGIGISADIEQSYFWLSCAAKGGHRDAADFLQRVQFEMENKCRVKDQESRPSSSPQKRFPSISW